MDNKCCNHDCNQGKDCPLRNKAMNANTLADELDDIDAYEKHQVLLGKASEMLRQQQTDLDIALSYMKQYELQIKQLQVAYEQEQYRSKQWQERFESGRLT